VDCVFKPSLLVVDDEPDQAFLVELAAKRCECFSHVVVETDSEEALQRLSIQAEAAEHLPDLIVIDWKMPRLSGPELLSRIKDSAGLRHLPVIVLSSSNFDNDRDVAFSLGCRAFLQKPIGFSAFVEMLRDLPHYCLHETVR
jgi:two-component system response regulator